MIERIWRHGVPSAGLFAGALAWLTNTQANYALAGWACAAGIPWLTPVVAILLMLASLGGGLLSWRFWMPEEATPEEATPEEATPARDGSAAQPRRMLAGIGILSAVLFALVIAMQAMAGFVLTGCER